MSYQPFPMRLPPGLHPPRPAASPNHPTSSTSPVMRDAGRSSLSHLEYPPNPYRPVDDHILSRDPTYVSPWNRGSRPTNASRPSQAHAPMNRPPESLPPPSPYSPNPEQRAAVQEMTRNAEMNRAREVGNGRTSSTAWNTSHGRPPQSGPLGASMNPHSTTKPIEQRSPQRTNQQQQRSPVATQSIVRPAVPQQYQNPSTMSLHQLSAVWDRPSRSPSGARPKSPHTAPLTHRVVTPSPQAAKKGSPERPISVPPDDIPDRPDVIRSPVVVDDWGFEMLLRAAEDRRDDEQAAERDPGKATDRSGPRPKEPSLKGKERNGDQSEGSNHQVDANQRDPTVKSKQGKSISSPLSNVQQSPSNGQHAVPSPRKGDNVATTNRYEANTLGPAFESGSSTQASRPDKRDKEYKITRDKVGSPLDSVVAVGKGDRAGPVRIKLRLNGESTSNVEETPGIDSESYNPSPKRKHIKRKEKVNKFSEDGSATQPFSAVSSDSDLTSLSEEERNLSRPANQTGVRKSIRERKPNTRLLDQISQAEVSPRGSRAGAPSSRSATKQAASRSTSRPTSTHSKRVSRPPSAGTTEQVFGSPGGSTLGRKDPGVGPRLSNEPPRKSSSSQAISPRRVDDMQVDDQDYKSSTILAASISKRKPGRGDNDSDSPMPVGVSPSKRRKLSSHVRTNRVESSDEEEGRANIDGEGKRFTSPIHSRRKPQRQNYNEIATFDRLVNPEQAGSNIEDTDVMIVGSKVSPRKRRALSDSDSGIEIVKEANNASGRGLKGKAKATVPLQSLDPNVEIQAGKCLQPRYSRYFKCSACVGKMAGFRCAFENWRMFRLDPGTNKIVGEPFFDDCPPAAHEPPKFPSAGDFNRTPTSADSFYLQQTVVRWLLPLFAREVQHAAQSGATYKPAEEEDARLVCDFCATTVFGGSWACQHCAKEYCLDCKELLDQFQNTQDIAESAPTWNKDAGVRILRCTTNQGMARMHYGTCLRPVTRYIHEELKKDWSELIGFISRSQTAYAQALPLLALPFREHLEAVSAAMNGVQQSLPGQMDEEARVLATKVITQTELEACKSSTTAPSQPVDPTGLGLSHPFYRIDKNALSDSMFDAMWLQGVPLVVDGVGQLLKLDWTPGGFIKRTEENAMDQVCSVVDCQSQDTIGLSGLSEMSVADFFREYIKGSEREDKTIKKLKDWPAYTEFLEKFPDLYADFHQAMPVPDYTRRDGILNISAHFPSDRGIPDIGPKMYNAFAAKEGPGGHGSTRLHMDMADAINVLVHANPRENGSQGCAVWDIFRPEDADGLREFLLEKYSAYRLVDPIHSQLFYLDSEIRKELYEKKGIFSHRIYQYPGQAIMVPAGCAHQVCNLADCMKIACDFVSPQNVKRCETLSREFRSENTGRVWKADVLQLSNMNWYAWSSSRKLAGYGEQTEVDPLVRAAVDKLFEDLPRNPSVDCGTFKHDFGLAQKAPYKDTFVKKVGQRASARKPEASVSVTSPSRQEGRATIATRGLTTPMESMQVEEVQNDAALEEIANGDVAAVISHAVPAPLETPLPVYAPSIAPDVNGVIDPRPGPAPLPSAPVSTATSIVTIAAPPLAAASEFATQQQRWKMTLDRIADQYIEAASVSDVSNPDVVRGILAMAIKSSGLKLPQV